MQEVAAAETVKPIEKASFAAEQQNGGDDETVLPGPASSCVLVRGYHVAKPLVASPVPAARHAPPLRLENVTFGKRDGQSLQIEGQVLGMLQSCCM